MADSEGAELPLPHERDEKSGEAATMRPDEHASLHQAARDLERGLVDTDLRAVPGLDAEQRERLLREAAGGRRD